MGCRDGQPANHPVLIKDAEIWDDLTSALHRVIAKAGTAFVETDMRAHFDPGRMRANKRAAIDRVRRAKSSCPACGRPGYAVTKRLPGLQSFIGRRVRRASSTPALLPSCLRYAAFGRS